MKWLCVLNYKTGCAQLNNVGVVVADNKEAAMLEAKELFNVSENIQSFNHCIQVFDLKELNDWSYYF